MYIPLYVKSNYTFLSSLINIDKLVKKCKDKNITQVALCDNNMIATMYFYKTCKNSDIKPIIGLEVKIEEKILLYAKNYNGYKNLIKIATLKDKLNLEILKKYKDDIICIIPYKSLSSYNILKDIFINTFIGVSNKEEEIASLNLTERVAFVNEVLYLEKNESKYFKSLSTVVFDIVDAFESVGCSFNRIGYVTSIFLSEKYIDIYKKHYLNVDNLNDVLELNLSWYLKLQTSKVSLNCWEKIITNKLEFPDLLVQYDINTPVDKEITTDMKFIKEFFKVSEDFIESRML